MKHPKSTQRSLMTTSGLFLAALVGTFMALGLFTAAAEGWSVLDGLYFAMASITTVGYGDLHPTTTISKWLALILNPVGVFLVFGIGFLALTNILRNIVTRVEPKMVDSALQDHYIVCGYGKVGQVVVHTLRRMGKQLCVVDRSSEKVEELRSMGISYVVGDAMRHAVLEDALIKKAGTLVTTFDDDAHNVYVVLEARDLSPKVKVIATASNEDAARKLYLAGARRVVSPAAMAGDLLAKSAANPDMIDMLSDVSDVSAGESSVSQVSVQEESWIAGLALREIGRRLPGVRVIIARSRGGTEVAPSGDLLLEPGMVLLVLGSSEGIRKLSKLEPPEDDGDAPPGQGA